MKNKQIYTYERQEKGEIEFSKRKFLKIANEFFTSISSIQKNEVIYIVKSFVNYKKKVIARGVYYGTNMSPLSFLINSSIDSEDVFIAEATTKKETLDFLMTSKEEKSDENFYIFKVLYKNSNLSKIESIYGGSFDLDLYMFEYDVTTNKRKDKVHFSQTFFHSFHF